MFVTLCVYMVWLRKRQVCDRPKSRDVIWNSSYKFGLLLGADIDGWMDRSAQRQQWLCPKGATTLCQTNWALVALPAL
jgi:hypothetical protein